MSLDADERLDGPRWWRRLSGAELEARLVQRGVGLVSAGSLVRDRDGTMAAQIIDRYLGTGE